MNVNHIQVNPGYYSCDCVDSSNPCFADGSCVVEERCPEFDKKCEKIFMMGLYVVKFILKWIRYFLCNHLDFISVAECPRLYNGAWCTHPGSEYSKKDCDGDGILDHICQDNIGRTGTISLSQDCKTTWPSGSIDSCSGL